MLAGRPGGSIVTAKTTRSLNRVALHRNALATGIRRNEPYRTAVLLAAANISGDRSPRPEVRTCIYRVYAYDPNIQLSAGLQLAFEEFLHEMYHSSP